MKEWFSQLAQREQLSVLVLASVVLIYLLYSLFWAPLNSRREALIVQNEAVAESRVRVDAMVSQIMQLRKSGAQSGARRNLTSVINESTTRFKLPVIRMQPNRQGEIQVRLENADFGAMMQWLHEMENGKGLLVRELSLTQAGTSGLVNITVKIAEAG